MPILKGEKLGFALRSGGLIAGMALAHGLWTGSETIRARLPFKPEHARDKEVTVLGPVRHPGIYALQAHDSVADLIRRAGGAEPPRRTKAVADDARAAEVAANGRLETLPWLDETRWHDGRQKERKLPRSPRYQP